MTEPTTKYRTAPVSSEKMPTGIPFIISNEVAERFSFYGMRGILVVFMTQYLMGRNGELATLSAEDAQGYYHLFVAAAYFMPFLGALLSDIVLGKYRTIIYLSLVYCMGHLALAMDETALGLFAGLILIAIGSGGIKPCVSAHVGDQFGRSNQHLLSSVYGWFYLAINLGSFMSTLLTPWLLEHYGPALAFGVPGIFMGAATITFWAGRNRFVHVPPAGRRFVKDALSGEGRRSILNLGIIFVFLAAFWSLFDQTGSSWVIQAQKLDSNLFGWDILEAQMQALNPFFILLFIPIFNYLVYPAINKVFPLTPLRKISIGLFIMSSSFTIPMWLEMRIGAGETPSIAWQILAYGLLTAAEVMVSVTALEFFYTQAPKTMKSFIVSFYLLAISAGNLFTALVNFFIQNDDGTSKLEGPSYFLFFTLVMLVAAVLFIGAAKMYKGTTYIQEEASSG